MQLLVRMPKIVGNVIVLSYSQKQAELALLCLGKMKKGNENVNRDIR